MNYNGNQFLSIVSVLRKEFKKSRKIADADVNNKLQITKEAKKFRMKPSKVMLESLLSIFDIIQSQLRQRGEQRVGGRAQPP